MSIDAVDNLNLFSEVNTFYRYMEQKFSYHNKLFNRYGTQELLFYALCSKIEVCHSQPSTKGSNTQ